MGSSRIALIIDDDLQRRRLVTQIGSAARILELADSQSLMQLAGNQAIDTVIAGVLNRNDPFLSSTLRQLGRFHPEIAVVGVFEPSRPSLDEAADLARQIQGMGFVCRPGPRFGYLLGARPRSAVAPTFSPHLIGCIDGLPLFGAAKSFALLQALHPSFAMGIPEQARELGLSRRNLERWFQGPDICSAGCFQSVCAAGEAAYLKMIGGSSEREIAAVVEVLGRDGIANPVGVARSIRRSLRLGLEELRAGGIAGLVAAVGMALRTPRDPSRTPVQWEPETRYALERGVIPVPIEDRIILQDAARGLEYPLDQFGMEAWPLLAQGMSFSGLVLELAGSRREPPHLVRARLVSWLSELLVLRLIRRQPGRARAGEA